jgi:hypothetical protein
MHAVDFRENLIVDRNHPILVQKAWRDHYQDGSAHLAAPYGEDALTWNVFRSLEQANQLEVVQRFFGLTKPIQEILYWGCSPDGKSDAQQELSIALRGLDGRQKGPMTEPDIVLLTEVEVCFDENKLHCGKEPWAASKKKEGWKKRWRDYRTYGFGNWLPEQPDADHRRLYQLVRNAIYAKLLAGRLGRPHVKVVSLVSRTRCQMYPILQEQYERFKAMTALITVDPLLYWEDLHCQILESVPKELATRISGKMQQAFGVLSQRSRA